MSMYGGASLGIFILPVTFVTHFMTRFKGGQVSWCVGVKSHIFGTCQKVFFRLVWVRLG